VVGMVVADPEASLLTVCANGYGKRTPFGPNSTEPIEPGVLAGEGDAEGPEIDEPADAELEPSPLAAEDGPDTAEETGEEADAEEGVSSQRSYRTQHRGGKGLHDIKTTDRNGPVIGISRVRDSDEVMMISARGKIQRIPVSDISTIGRNTQGVRIMNLDESDKLVAVKRVPAEEGNGIEHEPEAPLPPGEGIEGAAGQNEGNRGIP